MWISWTLKGIPRLYDGPMVYGTYNMGLHHPRLYSRMIDFTIVPEYNHLPDEEAASGVALIRYAKLNITVSKLLYVLC